MHNHLSVHDGVHTRGGRGGAEATVFMGAGHPNNKYYLFTQLQQLQGPSNTRKF